MSRPRLVVQRAQADTITSVAFAPSGRYAASASQDGSVAVWDMTAGALVQTVREPTVRMLERLSWLDDERLSVEGDAAGDFEHPKRFVAHALDGRILAAPVDAWSPLGSVELGRDRWAVVEDDALRVADVAGAVVATLGVPPGAEIDLVVAAANERWLVAPARVGGGHELLAWRLDALDAPPKSLGAVGAVQATALGARAVFVLEQTAAADGESTVGWRAVPLDGGATRMLAEEHRRYAEVESLVVAPDGRLLAATIDGVVVVRDAADGEELWRYEQPFAYHESAHEYQRYQGFGPLAFSPDSRVLVAGDASGKLYRFDARSGRWGRPLGAELRFARGVQLLDRDRLVVLSGDVVPPHIGVRAFSLAQARGVGTGVFDGLVGLDAADGGGVQIVRAWDYCGERERRGMVLETATWRALVPTEDVVRGHCWRAAPIFSEGEWRGWRSFVWGARPRLLAEPTSRGGGGFTLLDVETGSVSAEVDDADCPVATHVSADGQRISGADDGRFCAWSREGAIVARGRLEPPARARVLAFADDGSALARVVAAAPGAPAEAEEAAGDAARRGSSQVEVFDLRDGHLVQSFRAAGEVADLAVGPGGTVVGLVLDGVARLYRAGHSFAVLGGGTAPAAGDPTFAGLDFDPSGARAATVHDDGAVRVWDAESGRLLGTLLDFEDDEWAIVAPDGSYVGTSEVDERIGWVFDAPVEHFSFERFRSDRRSADRVRRALAGEFLGAAPALRRPPRITIVAAPDEVGDASASVTVRVQSEGSVDRVRLFVEGRPVADAPVCAPSAQLTLSAPLFRGMNRVTAVSFDTEGLASNAASVAIASRQSDATAPELFVVAVGIDEYPHLPPSMWLGAARADATAFIETLGEGARGHFAAVHGKLLADDEATPDAIRAALEDMARMGPDDLGVVFLAGHGFKPAESEDMVFATSEIRFDAAGALPSGEALRAQAIGWRDISERLARARGRLLVLLDACHAGHVSQELVVPNASLAVELGSRAGAVVLAASKGRQKSFEPAHARALKVAGTVEVGAAPASGHGVFTQALLDSLAAAETDRDGDHWLQLSELVDSVVRRVGEATQGAQTPWIARRDMFGDFALVPAPPDAAPSGEPRPDGDDAPETR